MQITHGGFQRGMAHRFLNGARVGAPFQTVGCIPVAEFVREDGDAEFAAGQLDGALDIGLVHAVPNLDPCSWMETGMVCWKKPSPRPGELVIGVFPGQLKRKHKGNAILLIAQPDGAGKFDLLGQIRNEGRGQGNDPVLAALGADDKKGKALQTDIFDPQIKGLRNPQPAAVEEACNQVGGITGDVTNGLEQSLGFGDGGRMAEVSRPFGPEGVDALEGLAEDFLVKEEDGIESLVLAAGGQVMMPSQVGQETFEFLLAGKGRGHAIESGDEATEPKEVNRFCGERFVLTTKDAPETFDGKRQIHDKSRESQVGLDKCGPREHSEWSRGHESNLNKRTTGSFIQGRNVDYERVARYEINR